ncbi:MAG: SDR family NAD(P)-dependent oxidoreductase [Rhodothermales bacterium]
MIRLDNKIAWITGAAGNIGRALAIGFARRGAVIAASDITEDNSGLEAELQAFNSNSFFCQHDVTKPEDANRVAAELQERFGHLDILINNAGIDPRKPAGEIEDQDWSRVLDTNLSGAWYTAQAALPLLMRSECGKIIQVGSITAHTGFKHMAHYVSSKMGLEGMTRGLARDLGEHGIRVNCLVLGAVSGERESELGSPEEIEATVSHHQSIAGRILPEDVESVFAFFASPDSEAITGQSIRVDLGWTYG